MRGALVPAAAAVVSVGAAVGATAMAASAGRAPANHKVVRIGIRNFKFSPARVVVSPGTRIVWTNDDSDPHTVVSRSGPAHWSSPALDTGKTFTQTVRRKGTVKYFCSIHPFMHGTVVVR